MKERLQARRPSLRDQPTPWMSSKIRLSRHDTTRRDTTRALEQRFLGGASGGKIQPASIWKLLNY
jgi:hypothetical protein